MDNIINNYWVNNHLEVYAYDDDGKRVFVIVDTDSGIEEEISEYAARVMCMTPDSSINMDNWDDFCTASGYFTEDN